MSNDATFLTPDILQQYVSESTLQTLQNIRTIAKEAKLSSKHLYKDFQGIFAQGNLDLLKQPKVAIVGTRTPNQYTKYYSSYLATELVSMGCVIVSGGAIGVDSVAHQNSKEKSIVVLPSGVNMNYPKESAKILDFIRTNGLVLSEYEYDFMPRKHSFLERNRIIIALSDIVIIPQADIRSGSSSSANLSVALGKPLFVLPHRLNESLGTQELLDKNHARCIYNIESFFQITREYFKLDSMEIEHDELIEFAKNHGSFDVALEKFGDKVLEYELEGKIKRVGHYIVLCSSGII
ncbi:DNA processing protein DprA [Helicobacter didelphidarum]|uniref:DNA processing protein DprA n=1 Tax=Helicobacter didelphidarum TaxID=2040648 RepID=A0A3D8IP55_9HELI|nr:DNA-processing protein DprA [Helicobacter didelphidarum]RDU66686.1 DNA processing protein DprA [Helicobacter didelphidarum]